MLKSSTLNIPFPSNLTANFLTIALPTLLTNALLGSAIKDNSMLKDIFAMPGTMASSLPKFRNLTNSNWFWSISLELCIMITFSLVPFMPLVILREWPGFNFFHIPLLERHLMWRVMVIPRPSVILSSFWSIIHEIVKKTLLVLMKYLVAISPILNRCLVSW